MADTPQTEETVVGTDKPKRTVYHYDKLAGTSMLAYTGQSFEIDLDAPNPMNTSEWKPPILSEGQVAYFDGFGWLVAKDITKLDLDSLKKGMLAQADQDFLEAEEALSAGYTSAETKSWSKQVSAAETILAGGDSDMLDALAASRKIDVKALAQKIVAKATAHDTAYTQLLADYQASKDKINAAKAVTDLPAITISTLRTVAR